MLLPRRLIRFGFHLLYNQMAFTYDGVASAVSLGQWTAWGRTALDLLRGRRVLELGHGPGHLLVALARSGFEPIGLDVSPYMLRQAQRRVRRAQLPVPQIGGRVPYLPFRSGAFESVVATFPTEYIAEAATLREVNRVLDAQGRLVVVMGASLSGAQLSVRVIDWLYRITGQHEPIGLGETPVFEQAGFSAQMQIAQVGRSQVALIVADKVPRFQAE